MPRAPQGFALPGCQGALCVGSIVWMPCCACSLRAGSVRCRGRWCVVVAAGFASVARTRS
eukprot:11193791-Lingulodinium_polyedra.AAC.1